MGKFSSNRNGENEMQHPKVIAHMDMDAFFAAVEQRDNPSLCGKPVVVGADPKEGKGRGVVSTCSYEARVFGIHSAMPISKAYRLCPQAVYLPPDFRKYKTASEKIFMILERFTPDIEPISIDEAFLDITGTFHLHGSAIALARKIKQDIRREVNLAASIGIAPVKMVAKIASDVSKPDGLLEVKLDEVDGFLSPLPVERLWGVGKKSKEILNSLGVLKIGDLLKLSRVKAHQLLGEQGLHLLDLAAGIDPRVVSVDDHTKSVSHEYTFDVDEPDPHKVVAILFVLSQKVSRRLRKEGLKGRTVTIKVRLENFQTFTRAITLDKRTNFVDLIDHNARQMFLSFFKKGMRIRLIGVRVSGFEDPYVSDGLFTDPADEKKEKVHHALDLLKDKFGEKTIHWGA
jgi:nucleotidyltransferase/DNA polymerase involved in DNA repair